MFDSRDRSGKRLDLGPTIHLFRKRRQHLIQKCSTRSGILEEPRVDQCSDRLVVTVIRDLQLVLHIDSVVQKIKRFPQDTFDDRIRSFFRTKQNFLEGWLHPPGVKGLSQRGNRLLKLGAAWQIILETL